MIKLKTTAELLGDKITAYRYNKCSEEGVAELFRALSPFTGNEIKEIYNALSGDVKADLFIYFLYHGTNIKTRHIAESTGVTKGRINQRRQKASRLVQRKRNILENSQIYNSY